MSIHADFRNILCPDNLHDAAANEMEAVLFGEDKPHETSFELDSAYQGQEGFEMVKRALAEHRPFALAFVDVRMPPGWDGIETIARMGGGSRTPDRRLHRLRGLFVGGDAGQSGPT